MEDQPWTNPLLGAIIAGLVATGLLGWFHARSYADVLVALLVAGAAFGVGALTGFLFAIPRAVQEPQDQRTVVGLEAPYRVNTNLEQISDWLTKIIVGLGLVELTKTPGAFVDVAQFVANAFGQPAVPPSLAAVMIAYFGVAGFLLFYLWTRLFLTFEFTRADRAARQSPEFYEGLIEALLYQPPPNGFDTAIEIAEEFRRRYGDGNWRVWRAVACAYGQKYSYLEADPKTQQTELDFARAHALDAVRRVLAISPDERESMRALWKKDATREENDLVVFYDDPEFKKLLGSRDDKL